MLFGFPQTPVSTCMLVKLQCFEFDSIPSDVSIFINPFIQSILSNSRKPTAHPYTKNTHAQLLILQTNYIEIRNTQSKVRFSKGVCFILPVCVSLWVFVLFLWRFVIGLWRLA